eukprot:TRINITY_DN4906_c0_g1_i1.p1 TRINITY_DN4906_c0_g1~~TRINITY_DN4906_c0_g1_i1.p1  ORF type:complete len:141 (-),score=21.93 TRINITY_DN4906_c0_g1_i1:33-455(-)
MNDTRIFSFFIFNNKDELLYHQDWQRDIPLEEHIGLLDRLPRAINQFLVELSPDPNDQLNYFRTSTYSFHYFESGTGIRFIIMAEPMMPYMRNELQFIYANIFVNFVMKNPLYELGTTISSSMFSKELNRHIMGLTQFRY